MSTDENLATMLSEDECQVIVQKYNQETENNLKLLKYYIEVAIEAKGFLGEYFHLIIKCYQDNEKESAEEKEEKKFDDDAIFLKFFIKRLPQVHEQHEKVTIFRKESSLYGSLLKDLQKYSSEPWCPKVYLCYKNLLVLQDLESLGYQSLASKENVEEIEMLPIFKGLAAIHASSLIYEQQNENNIQESYYECLKEITVHPEIPWFTTGLKALLEIAKYHSKYQSEVSQKFITDELPHHLKSIYFMVNPSPKYRNVLCHRDTWGGNIFINPKNPSLSAIFVDFQTCRYSPPAIDVVLTLFMNLSKDERLAKQSQYLTYYYQQLKHHLTTFNSLKEGDEKNLVITESEFLESFEEFQLFGFVYRALAATILKVPKEFVTDYYKNEERAKKLLEYMQENKEFCLLMEECIEDIIETVVDMAIRSDIY